MKKTALIIGFLGVFIMLVGMPSAFAEPAEITGWQPFTDTFFNCGTGEAISITGMDKYVEKDAWLDASGGYHVLAIYMARGYGIGEGGSGYRFDYRQPVELTNNGEYTFLVNGVVIALDKGVPDLHGRWLVHVTYDANGNLRSDIDFFDIDCTEP